mgnify:FL=1
MVGVDHLKKNNDTNGHLAGDRALATVAAVLEHGLNAPDLIARYGGEEFAIFLPDTDGQDGMKTAQRLCETIAASQILSSNNQSLPGVTVSIGLAAINADESHEDLAARADTALYKAKSAGRNRAIYE